MLSASPHLSVPSARRTLLPRAGRVDVARDPRLGGGNVWQTALAHSRDPDATLVVADPPIPGVDGLPRAEFGIAALCALADAWSAWYLAQGVRPRDRVGLYIEDSFEEHAHLAALAQLGAIAVVVNGRLPGDVVLGLLRRADAIGLYTDAAHLQRLAGGEKELPSLRWAFTRDDAGDLSGAVLPDRARYRHGDSDPVFLCHSSGTTGNPKLVTWTHRQSVAGPAFRLAAQPEPADSLLLCAAPLSHGAAIAVTLFALLAGLPTVALSDRSAAGLSRAADLYRPTTVFAFNHALAELALSDADPEAFSSVRDWANVGDSAHEAHVRRLVRLGHRHVDGERVPGSVFHDILGSSELGWAALRRTTTADTPSAPRHLGRPVGGMKVAVLREDGTPAGPDEVGMLGVRGDSVTTGYWNDDDTYHRSRLAGYFLSGDLVRRNAANEYFHVDRIVDTIPTAGATGHSVLMEDTLLLALPEAADCAVVAGGDRGATVPVAVVRLRDGDTAAQTHPDRLLARANSALAAIGQPPLAALEIAVTDDDLPVGATGKVLKRRLREKYRDLPAHLATAPHADAAERLAVAGYGRPRVDVAETLSRIAEDVLEADAVALSDGFHTELRIDSLQKIEIVTRVERAFDVRFEAEEAAGADSLADLLDLLTRRGPVTAAPEGGAR
ncbi:AMP-binding protein [Yinghuangia seranimata]|uniref:AMP-binding protein n=1 Tax=Yinghuangia seranimata TaxID=408067 RepID=UPI00248C1513|nr:AMP-binding protein [Yinghuangia seranimata]MDI2125667.1 AMP-binding protein [Yinghuangia seranimata]